MKKRLAVIALVVMLLVGFAADEKARANTAVSFNMFYSSLSPYGNWVPMDYGYAWSPTGVGPGWRPYMDGQWVWSDLGWTWSSYEPWGWATYHYGRWVMDPAYGWLWIPGTTWAPAWVSWYQTPGYVGWSPLPPDNNFFLSIGVGVGGGGYYGGGYYGGGYYGGGYYGGGYYGGGYYGGGGYYPGYYGGGNYFRFNYYDYGYGYKHGKYGKDYGKYRRHDKGYYYDNDYYAPGEECVFVPEDKFGYRNAKLVAVGVDKNRDLVTNRNLRNVTNIKVDEGGKVYNLGPDRTVLETSGRAKIERVSLVDSDLATVRDRSVRGRSANENGKFAVYRPNIERKEGENPFSAEPVYNPGQRDRNNGASGTDRASLDRGSLNPGQNNLRTGSRGGNDFTTGGVRNPAGSGALENSGGPGEYGVIRRNGSRNGAPENQRLGSIQNERPGMTPNGLAPNGGAMMRPQRGNVNTGPEAPAISRPENSGPVMNPPSASRPQNYGPGGNGPSMNRPQNFGPGQGPVSRPEIDRQSGPSMNRQNYSPSASRPQSYAPTMNRPSNNRPQMNERLEGPGPRSMMRPDNFAPDAGRPSMNRQQSYSPQRMSAPTLETQRSAPSMDRQSMNRQQSSPSRMRAPERQSAPVMRNISAPAPRQSYDRGGSRQGGRQSVQPRSNNSRPSGGSVRSGGGGGSRQSYDRGSSRSSGGSMRSAPSSSRGGSGGGRSFRGSSVRGR